MRKIILGLLVTPLLFGAQGAIGSAAGSQSYEEIRTILGKQQKFLYEQQKSLYVVRRLLDLLQKAEKEMADKKYFTARSTLWDVSKELKKIDKGSISEELRKPLMDKVWQVKIMLPKGVITKEDE